MAMQELDTDGSDRADAALPSRFGDFRISVFRVASDETEVIAMARGDLRAPGPVLVRLHSECLTGESLGSLRCDCGDQLSAALEQIGRADRGVLLYLRHEGRGIGLFDKIRAYALQDRGLDTVEANVALGLPIDARDYASAVAVLRRLGVRRVRVLTNNPLKLRALGAHGIDVVERVPLEMAPNPVSLPYLVTKRRRIGAPPCVASAAVGRGRAFLRVAGGPRMRVRRYGGDRMPPRGVTSTKRKRQYEHIKRSELARGRSNKTAERIAAATTIKTRRKKGETKSSRKRSSRRKKS